MPSNRGLATDDVRHYAGPDACQPLGPTSIAKNTILARRSRPNFASAAWNVRLPYVAT